MHKLLMRQLKRHFGDADSVPAALFDFVAAVDEAYQQADADRELLERSLDLTSEELLEANAELRLDREALEKRVAERTAELLAANRRLEREISERRAAEQRLRASELRFQTLADNSPTGIFYSDASGRTVYVNRAWCEIAGLSPEQAAGDGWQQAIHPEDRQRKIEDWERALAKGAPVSGGEYRMLRPDGTEKWVVGQAVPLTDAEGAVSGFVGTVTDITERRLAEEAIRRSEEKYRTLFEESQDTIYISTPDGRLLDINPAGVRLFGYDSLEELLQVDLAAQVYRRAEDRERMLQELSLKGFVQDLELLVQTKQGRHLTVLATSSAERDADGRVISIRGMLRDVTGQRSLEHQLRQAQKMEAVGRLAGGVSHDFNNLLTAILGYADLLALALPGDSPLRRHTDEIKAAAQRGADLTRQLLAFGRQQVLAPEILDLNEIVLTIEKLLRRVIGEDIELVTKLDPALGAVRADPSQIEQVLLNLGINGRDAMPEGGVLTLRTGNVEVQSEPEVPPLGLARGDHVMLEVEDSGIGIDEEIRDQIFEPFFTTKSRSKGSGLGLATVYGIVRQSGGQIEVHSEPGLGSRFRILLPRIEEQPTTVRQVSHAPGMPKGDETILLVEDEPAVRDFLGDLLERLGYSVVTAEDGRQALEIAAERRGQLDLLLSDVVMPRMNGVDLARRLTAEEPGLRVLLISGHAEKPEALMEQRLSGAPVEFLQKPFSALTLAERLRRILNAAKADQPVA
jgi:two-component system cell cycle sensor histidine kinase/response regulator CckA